jgi:hypothetical protein
MHIRVLGSFDEPVLLDTNKATCLIISSDDGKPNVLYRIVHGGKGWIRYTKGEDKAFDDIAASLGLLK